MTPTPKLRWVEKQLENFEVDQVFAQGNFSYKPRKLRVLQQWWDFDTFAGEGEWKDVPCERE
jgi:hypothetical protein